MMVQTDLATSADPPIRLNTSLFKIFKIACEVLRVESLKSSLNTGNSLNTYLLTSLSIVSSMRVASAK